MDSARFLSADITAAPVTADAAAAGPGAGGPAETADGSPWRAGHRPESTSAQQELTGLGMRLTEQLRRLRGQWDFLVDAALRKMEERVDAASNGPLALEWQLSGLGSAVRGLQEGLRVQARRANAVEAR
eukprot:8886916-Lingulodinium_polyedra.AAC.1